MAEALEKRPVLRLVTVLIPSGIPTHCKRATSPGATLHPAFEAEVQITLVLFCRELHSFLAVLVVAAVRGAAQHAIGDERAGALVAVRALRPHGSEAREAVHTCRINDGGGISASQRACAGKAIAPGWLSTHAQSGASASKLFGIE
eukprot:567799-Prymnesium_polylepis.2